uniref:Uncharacterized protein n=1 Tax=Anguilla anguilla TaxID=7936 RepID=A0A0E9UAU5_ANGAN
MLPFSESVGILPGWLISDRISRLHRFCCSDCSSGHGFFNARFSVSLMSEGCAEVSRCSYIATTIVC